MNSEELENYDEDVRASVVFNRSTNRPSSPSPPSLSAQSAVNDPLVVRAPRRARTVDYQEVDDDYEEETIIPSVSRRNRKVILSEDDELPPQKKSKRQKGKSVGKSVPPQSTGHYFQTLLSGKTSVDEMVSQAVTNLAQRSTIRAADGDKDYHRLENSMLTTRPSRASWMPNPYNLSLQSIMTRVIQRGYELIQSVQDEDTDLDQPCFDFLRELPPPTFADMVIRGGMTPKQVQLMDGGRPFTSDAFFAAAAPISHDRRSIGVYLTRFLRELDTSGQLEVFHYDGAGA